MAFVPCIESYRVAARPAKSPSRDKAEACLQIGPQHQCLHNDKPVNGCKASIVFTLC